MTKEAQNFPLQHEVTTQKVIVHVSDVNNLNSETYIVCQRPNVFNVPYDSDSYLMMDLTVGNCRRDSHRLQSLVNNAINDIQQISNLKITDTVETFFCKIIFQKLILTPLSIILAQLDRNNLYQFSQISSYGWRTQMTFGPYWTSSIDRIKLYFSTMNQSYNLPIFLSNFTISK